MTQEYLDNAKPRTGNVTYDEGYEISENKDEVDTAQWIHENLGGDIKLMTAVNQDKQRTADYLWKSKYWDLKTITTEKAANSAIRHGLTQIKEKPGGIILNFKGNNLSQETLWKVVEKRLGWYKSDGKIDILVLSNGKLVAVKRY